MALTKNRLVKGWGPQPSYRPKTLQENVWHTLCTTLDSMEEDFKGDPEKLALLKKFAINSLLPLTYLVVTRENRMVERAANKAVEWSYPPGTYSPSMVDPGGSISYRIQEDIQDLPTYLDFTPEYQVPVKSKESKKLLYNGDYVSITDKYPSPKELIHWNVAEQVPFHESTISMVADAETNSDQTG
jgi:hypothetical protein